MPWVLRRKIQRRTTPAVSAAATVRHIPSQVFGVFLTLIGRVTGKHVRRSGLFLVQAAESVRLSLQKSAKGLAQRIDQEALESLFDVCRTVKL